MTARPVARRPLGATGLAVSEIGFGAWGIGGETAGATSYGRTDDAASVAAIEAALERGINFFDTANVYGDGHSERLLGQVLAPRRDQAVIATKAGFLSFDAPPDFRPGAVSRSLEGSLRRLRTDYVDVLQLHNPPIGDRDRCLALADELDQLRESGRIRAAGWSLKRPEDAIAAIRDYRAAVVQLNFNLLDWRAIDAGVFAMALGRVGVIARTPLCFGILTGTIGRDTQFALADHRSLWPRAQVHAWLDAAEALFAAIELPFAAASALRFCLSHQAVSTVIAGMLTPDEVAANAVASALDRVSGDRLDRAVAVYRGARIFVTPDTQPAASGAGR